MDFDSYEALDARLLGLSGAICALFAVLIGRAAMPREDITGALRAYRAAAVKMNAGDAGLAEVDRLIAALDAVPPGALART